MEDMKLELAVIYKQAGLQVVGLGHQLSHKSSSTYNLSSFQEVLGQ